MQGCPLKIFSVLALVAICLEGRSCLGDSGEGHNEELLCKISSNFYQQFRRSFYFRI